MGSSIIFKKNLLKKYGPWALVTGASSGIGREITRCLADSGFNLILVGRHNSTLESLGISLEEEHGIITEEIEMDIGILPNVAKLIDHLKDIPIGLLVASAGFGTSGEFIKTDANKEREMLMVNSVSLMLLTHHFARSFAQQKKGGIILMSSIVGFQGTPNAANYAASKAYVQSLGEALYHELKPYKVDILSAAPGPVSSGFARVANMKMDTTLDPEDIAWPILKSLGKKSTVFPGGLTKILVLGLRTVPRWGKIRIMKKVMGGMTNHQG